MCEFCARELNPGLIDKMRSELPDNVASNGDAKALLVAAVVGRNVQLQDERVFFSGPLRRRPLPMLSETKHLSLKPWVRPTGMAHSPD